MRVSVVVPLYNKAAFLQRCLDSIFSQTHTDFEAIIVDDGSTDGGAESAAKHSDQRFRLIRQANAGPGAARNRGLAASSSDLVAFLDADDEWHREFLEQGLAALANDPNAVAVSFGLLESFGADRPERPWSRPGLPEGSLRVTPSTDPRLLATELMFMTPCNTLCRTAVIRSFGGFYDSGKCLYGEDGFLWLKVLLNHTVIFNQRPLVRIHRDASGLSTNLKRARPVEALLLDPDQIRRSCPPDLRPLLDQLLAIRAFKTACMLGYWGHWQEARALRRRFPAPQRWRLPYFVPSLACSTPLGSAFSAVWRMVRG